MPSTDTREPTPLEERRAMVEKVRALTATQGWSVHAKEARVLLEHIDWLEDNSIAIDSDYFRDLTTPVALRSPVERGEGEALAAGLFDNARELREVVDLINLCIYALEGRDGADVCTELAVAGHRIDMVIEAVALELAPAPNEPEPPPVPVEPPTDGTVCGSQGIDADGHCVRCGCAVDPQVTERCPPGFLAPVPAEGEQEEGECSSCGEGMPRGECPKSRRECGHHCNHSWSHDRCCWCEEEFGEEEEGAALPVQGQGQGERERAIEDAARELDDYAESIDELPRDAEVVRECASMVRALAAIPIEPAKHADQVGTSSDQVDARAALTRLYLAAHRAGVEAAAEVLSGTTKGWRTLVAARDTLAEDARADTEDEYNWTDPRSPLARALAALPVQVAPGDREQWRIQTLVELLEEELLDPCDHPRRSHEEVGCIYPALRACLDALRGLGAPPVQGEREERARVLVNETVIPAGEGGDLRRALHVATNTPDPTPAPQPEEGKHCGVCGGPEVVIRAQHPKGPPRNVCPTCIADRLAWIHEHSSPHYGVAAAAAPTPEEP